MEKKGYSVSEAVRLVGVESHVLRYWEEELQVEIRRTSQGHRIYSQENIETFCMVRELKEYGLQLKAIRFLLDKTVENRKKAELTEQIFEIGGGRESFSREGEPVQGKTKRTAKTREARETFWDNTEETAEELEMEEEEEAFWDNTEEAEETETGGKEAPFWGDAEEAETGGKKSPFWDDAEEELKTEEEEAPFWDDAEETEDEAAEKGEMGEGVPFIEEETDMVYDIVVTPLPDDGLDKFRQFEEILKRIIGDVIEEKNQKMELSLRRMFREELDQFFLLYQDIASEAAAERETRTAKKGFFRRLWELFER